MVSAAKKRSLMSSGLVKNFSQVMSIRRAAFLLAISALIILLMVFLSGLPIHKTLFAVDYSEYWVAAKLVLRGENPYQSQSVMEVLNTVDWPYDDPIMMYNPPWTLGLVLPLGMAQYFTGRLLWFLLFFMAVILSMNALWAVYGLPPSKMWLAWVLGLCFIPTLQALDVGQISPLILLGIAGFLHFVDSRKWVLAGGSAFLISIKPQLLYLFWPILILWVLREKRWVVLVGCLGTGIAFLLLPMVFNLQILTQYISEYLGRPPFYFETPLISYSLRVLIGQDKYWVQFVPSVIGLVWGIYYWYRNRSSWNWREQMPLIILVSFLTSSYAWNHDQVVFLPMIVQALSWFSSQQLKTMVILVTYFVIDLAMLVSIWIGQTQSETIWQPFVWAGFYLLARGMKVSERLSTQLSGPIDG